MGQKGQKDSARMIGQAKLNRHMGMIESKGVGLWK